MCGQFCFNAILSHVRAQGDVALAVASSGIASILLGLGRTFHSRFKASLKPKDSDYLNIKSQTALARLVRMAKLLKLFRMAKLLRYMRNFEDFFNPAVVRMTQIIFGMILCCHWFGCLWWLISELEQTGVAPPDPVRMGQSGSVCAKAAYPCAQGACWCIGVFGMSSTFPC